MPQSRRLWYRLCFTTLRIREPTVIRYASKFPLYSNTTTFIDTIDMQIFIGVIVHEPNCIADMVNDNFCAVQQKLIGIFVIGMLSVATVGHFPDIY